jgi:hypothetical protein
MTMADFFDPVSVREVTEHLRRALELDPNNPPAERMLKWVIISGTHLYLYCHYTDTGRCNQPAARLLAEEQDETSRRRRGPSRRWPPPKKNAPRTCIISMIDRSLVLKFQGMTFTSSGGPDCRGICCRLSNQRDNRWVRCPFSAR